MIDTLLLLQLFFDSGMLVLIWLTQLVIYPGLTFYSKADLIKWHTLYTTRMTYVVMPLMLAQFSCGISLVFLESALLDIIRVFMIGTAWLLTFIKAVPMHQKLSSSKDPIQTAHDLVKINVPRTVSWTLVCLITLTQVLY